MPATIWRYGAKTNTFLSLPSIFLRLPLVLRDPVHEPPGQPWYSPIGWRISYAAVRYWPCYAE
jgi:hypothetical protein